ncbi:MAG: cupredoxin family copper-binding protein [Candidatus Korobacteraceae bacterium]
MIKVRTSMLSIGILLVAIASGIGLITCAAAAPANASSEIAINIDNFSFSPATITVPVDTTVRWTNHDDIPHTVVSEDKVFKSQALDSDGDFTYTFTKPGTYSYFCSIHPKMVGKVVVQ